MSIPGGDKKPKIDITKIPINLPPLRTAQEWREITRMKLRQYEQINYGILGKKSYVGGSGE